MSTVMIDNDDYSGSGNYSASSSKLSMTVTLMAQVGTCIAYSYSTNNTIINFSSSRYYEI